ncbi:ATP-dependent RNA helicase A [Camelus dromedarius]|uniref:ATP-dependent RNA helicase A n=1 Tax=Camelus dromedarius TaxID=9838 RepID=A0A5N4CMW5_CAMDR|nr:ATP-dependent RNA helicase A [Camelus dromedarius]
MFSFVRIKLQMSHESAACVTALRAAVEALVVEVTKQPDIISQLDPVNERMLNTIRQISRPSAAGINLMIGNTRRKRMQSPRWVTCQEGHSPGSPLPTGLLWKGAGPAVFLTRAAAALVVLASKKSCTED